MTANDRYRMLFEWLDAGFCVLQMIYDDAGRPVDYRFLEVNQAFGHQTGLRDAMAKTMREHAPDHEEHWFETYAEVARSGKSRRFVQRAAALGRWFEVFAYPVDEPDSGKVGVLFNDVTARVQAEQALRESTRRKDEFLATLAHELRNPLAPIRSAVAFLRLAGPREPARDEAHDMIDRQVSQLVRLVDDLLDVSRITFGKVALQQEALDLREVAREAVAASEPAIEDASHRLELRLADDPVWVDGDPVRLVQVVSNLLNNAARYTPAGGEIALEVGEEGGEARVSVQDNGLGIPADMAERIFDPFVQIERPGSAAAGGIGIGLSLAKALVELHGGHISATSEGAGNGTRVTFRLPLAPGAARAEQEAAPLPPGARRRVLVVDDNVDATRIQAELLRLLGHEVETAYGGMEALDKARSFHPDIVLLDLGMPDVDGFEVARRLRATPEGRNATLVAQTGWSEEAQRRRSREAGFDAHFRKPVDFDTLMEIVGAEPRR